MIEEIWLTFHGSAQSEGKGTHSNLSLQFRREIKVCCLNFLILPICRWNTQGHRITYHGIEMDLLSTNVFW